MRDYAELVELIRSFACNQYPNCGECEMILNGHECRSAIERRAADAIEELIAELVALRNQLPQQTVETNIFDQEEIHHDCTVQILRNSVTGEVSVGWWPNDKNPNETEECN